MQEPVRLSVSRAECSPWRDSQIESSAVLKAVNISAGKADSWGFTGHLLGTLPLFLDRIVSRADREGWRVANGIYFYRLDTPGYRNVKKAVLMTSAHIRQ